MRRRRWKLLTVVLCGVALLAGSRGPAAADVLELVDGSIIWGNYVGGTVDTVEFEFIGGTGVFLRSEVLSLSLGEERLPPEVQRPGQVPIFYAFGPATVPAQTVLPVYIFDGISSRIYGPEYMFTGMLLTDLVADGYVLAERGTQVTGRMTRVRGRSRVAARGWLKLELTTITIGGITHYIETSWVRARNEVSVRRSANRIRAAQNASGFRTGQAVGTGGPVQTSGRWIEVPPGTVVEFGLAKPFVFSR